MTYIKSDAAKDQPSASAEKALNLAATAARQQNWLQLTNHLQELPTTHTTPNLFLLDENSWSRAFNLALEMLFKADFQHKWEITKITPWFGADIIPPLVAVVRDETIDVDIRWFVCQILGNFPDQKVVLTLVELLQQNTDSELTAIAGKTLTKIGDNAIDALVDLAAQPQHRLLAAKSLYYIRTANTVEPLLKFAEDPEAEIRILAIKALGSFHDERIAPVLIDSLKDKASRVRQAAAIALGFRSVLCQELNLVSHLRSLLHDLNLEVCRQAAISLGRMKQEEANFALFEVLRLETTPINLKQDLIKALGWSEMDSAIEYLKQTLDQVSEKKPEKSLDRESANSRGIICQEIITTLGRITTPELKPHAARVLVNFWQTRDQAFTNQTLTNKTLYSTEIKQALATALGELRWGCAQQTLEQLAADSDRKVRLYALSALKKLG